MNVYDFDHTIYNGDSTIDFWLFSLRQNPAIIRTVPRLIQQGLQYKFYRGNIEELKSAFFCFLPFFLNVEKEVAAFWDKHENRIFEWYLKQKQDGDVIISASPEFLLRECCIRLGVELIGTRINERTGRLIGKNCKGEEKVRRFRETFPNNVIHNFYSDSYTDTPLAKQAQQSFFVKKGKVVPWNGVQHSVGRK